MGAVYNREGGAPSNCKPVREDFAPSPTPFFYEEKHMPGTKKGDPCNRDGCTGEIDEMEIRDCNFKGCFPCVTCDTKEIQYCEECGWSSESGEA